MARTSQIDNEKECNNFNWLRSASRGPTYTSYSQFAHVPNSSFDWGEDGYAGCSNQGGELLYLSAPSKFGLIMARGHFSPSLYASLSRSQFEFGGPSTFGLEVAQCPYAYDPEAGDSQNDELSSKNGSSFILGSMIDRGCFNYRWPVTEYYLDRHPNQDQVASSNGTETAHDTARELHVGTCQIFSCAKDEMFYQVLHIEEGAGIDTRFPLDSQIVLTIGGPVWFNSFKAQVPKGRVAKTTMSPSLQFMKEDRYLLAKDRSPPDPTNIIRYRDNNKGRTMEIKVYQLRDGEYHELPMTRSRLEVDSGPKFQEEKEFIAAYNAVGKLKDLPLDKTPRSATFLAAIRLFDEDESGGVEWPALAELPNSKELYDHVGVEPTCSKATGEMWKSIFLNQPTKSDPVLDLAEFHLIGRSLEKILQVDILPAKFVDDSEEDHKEYATLVSNLFVRANIDLKSLFWKIRYLIRTHNFLSLLRTAKDKANESNITVKFQMERIQTKVENVIRYLAKALLEPATGATEEPHTRMMPDSHIPGESNYYYVMTTIWYVWNYCNYFNAIPDRTSDWKSDLWAQLATKQKRKPVLYTQNRLPSDLWTFATADREKVHLLQWYHYRSLMKLCEKGVLHESWEEPGLKQKVAHLEEAAKIVSSAKLSSRVPYSADDEIFDRLSFVSDELDLEKLKSNGKSNGLSSIEWLSLNRVKRRDFTRSLNPGWVRRGVERSTSGPWEIHALCHHSDLVVLMKEERNEKGWSAEKKAEAEVLKRRISAFLNSEGTLFSCWERAHANSRGSWLNSEVTAVVATTFINILGRALDGGSLINTDATDGDLVSVGTSAPEQQKKLLLEVLQLQGLLKTQVEGGENFRSEPGLLAPIQWTLFRLPRKYHPDNFFNSLEATPDLYKPDELNKFPVPWSLRTEIRTPDELGEFDEDKIRDEVLKMKCLSVVDIKATNPDVFVDPDDFMWQIQPFKYESEDSLKDLSWALYENLVDQEVQHRFLTVIPKQEQGKPDTIPRSLLELLVYVYHPESANCLGDHIRNFSRFSCQARDTWIASITLPSWAVQQAPPTGEELSSSKGPHGNPTEFSFPWKYHEVWEKVPEVNENMIFKLQVSSLILSTNAFGDFSKCTVVSGLFKDDSNIKSIIDKDVRKLLGEFIHQPQTARCLVFLLLTGKMCQKIVEDYEKAISKLDSVLIIDKILDGIETDKLELLYLGLSHWSSSALLKLQGTLNSIVVTMTEAKEYLMAQIQEGPGKCSLALEKICQEYLTEFESSLVQLDVVNSRLEQRMKLNKREEAIFETESEKRDRKLSLSQNATIERLTYLTIVYLPITLLSAIYAIPGEHHVLFNDMSLQWFLLGILIASVATYILAGYIGGVVEWLKIAWDFVKIPVHEPGSRRRKDHPENPPNLWKFLGGWLYSLFQSFHRKNGLGQTRERLIITDQGSNNPQKSMEEGKANEISVVMESVSIGDGISNGSRNP